MKKNISALLFILGLTGLLIAAEQTLNYNATVKNGSSDSILSVTTAGTYSKFILRTASGVLTLYKLEGAEIFYYDSGGTMPFLQTSLIKDLSGGNAFTPGRAATSIAATTAATDANTASTIVKRDGSGNFSAGTITATLSGAATSAGKSTNLVGGNNSTLLGSMPYQSNTDTTTLLGPNTAATQKFLAMTGNGTNGAAPSWEAISALPAGAQGDLLYYNGSAWVVLNAGDSGKYLKTQGAGANPIWDSPAGSGDVLGPATHAASYFPKWNGTPDSKTLVEGVAGGNSNGNVVLRTADNTVSADTVSEVTGGAGVTADGVKMLDSFLEITEIAAPADPAANKLRVYSKDSSGTSKLYFRDSAGTETEVGAGVTWAALMAAKQATAAYSADHTVVSGENGYTFSTYLSRANAFSANAAIAEYANDIVACWMLNETSGYRYDAIGGCRGEAVNAPGSGVGKNDRCYVGVAASSEYIKIPDTQVDLPALFESDKFSVSFWFKFSDSNVWEAMFAAQDGGSENGFVIGKNLPDAGKVKIVCYDGNTTTVSFESAASFNDNNWHHLVFAMEGGYAEAWLDGVSFGTDASASVGAMPSVHNPAIGANCANDVYSGYADVSIDELVFWDEGIQINAVTALYNAGSGRYYTGPVTFTLPAVADKLTYTFLNSFPAPIVIDPSGTDRITLLTAGENIYTRTAGATMTLYSDGNTWYMTSYYGTWGNGY